MKNGCLTPKEQLTVGSQLLIPWRQRDMHVAVNSIRAVGGQGTELDWVSIICEVKVTSLLWPQIPCLWHEWEALEGPSFKQSLFGPKIKFLGLV